MNPHELPDHPEDIVPRRGLDDATRKLLADANGQPVTVHIPGDVICDPDGWPIGIEEPTIATNAILIYKENDCE